MTIINTTDDLLRALDEQPAWYEMVRARILGEELLKLPAVFSAFVEQMTQFVAEQRQFNTEQRQFNAEQRQFNAEQRQFNAEQLQFNADQRQFNADQRQFNADQRQFNADQRQFNQQMESRVTGLEDFNQEQRRVNERIERRVTRIDQDIGQLRGYYAIIRTREHAPTIADEMGLNFVATLDNLTIVQYCKDPALGYASRHQLRSFRHADLLIEAHDGGKPLLVAVEVSYTADRRDTDRAIRNAHYLTQATGEAARPVIASVRNTHEAQELIDLGIVYWYEIIPEMLIADH